MDTPPPNPDASPSPAPLPRHLAAALDDLPPDRRPWTTGIATYAIGLFLWVAFYDRLAVRTLPVGGVFWSFLGAVAAGFVCYAGLFYAPAMLGLRTRRPLIVAASSTFGVDGAAWVSGVVMSLVQVAWFAVGTWYAEDLVFRGLILLGYLDPSALEPVRLGGLWFPSVAFLATALVWLVLIALLGATFLRLVLALNQVFPVVPALLLGGAMLALVQYAPVYEPPGVDPIRGAAVRSISLHTFGAMLQLVCGFFATAGVLAVDWGASSREERDVRFGGLVGVVMAPAILASVALLLVAGSLGRQAATPPPPATPAPVDPLGLEFVRGPGGVPRTPPQVATRAVEVPVPFRFTVRAAIRDGIGGPAAAVIFLTLGLTSMGPAAYAAYLFAQQLTALRPGLSRVRWKLVGVGLAWLMILAGWADKVEFVFGVLGAAAAALIGALSANSTRHRGRWPGPRAGVNVPGVVAWALGFAAGATGSVVGAALGWTPWPWTLLALALAFAAYLTLAAVLSEPEPIGARDPDRSLSA